MTKAESLKVKCLCGAVQFDVVPQGRSACVCHCGMCRRWSGGVFMVTSCNADFSPPAGDALGVYESSEWGERGFCKECGTSLFWRMRDKSHCAVSVSACEGLDDVAFDHQIFIDEKPDYYAFANKTHSMTGAEVSAMFSGEEKG